MRAVAVFLVLLFTGTICICISVKVNAIDSPTWTDDKPTIFKNSVYVKNISTGCSGNVLVKDDVSACLYGDKGLKIGYFNNEETHQGAVQFPYSQEIHRLEGVCDDAPCRYISDKDMVVAQRRISVGGLETVVFLHASKHIAVIYSSNGTVRYAFDTTRPDYVVADETGDYTWTTVFNVSENGKWLVAELNGIGIVVINTDSFESKQITTIDHPYSTSLDSIDQLAVSNDGKNVVLIKANIGITMFTITSTCGQELSADVNHLPDMAECPNASIDANGLFSDFHFAEYPHFSSDGYQLDVIVHSGSNEVRKVTFLAHGAMPTHQLQFLAFGDSFTSGEGETNVKYYESGTNDSIDNCHVSTRAYPFLIAARIGISTIDVKSVACAGAKVGDIIGSNDTYWGQGNRLSESGLNLSLSDKALVQQKALDTFQPGRVLQSAFLNRYNPKIITIGVGGNDAGLMGKLSVCAMPNTCEWAEGEGLKATANEIKRLADTLGILFTRISNDYPDSKVYVVGYPNIIDAEGLCDPVTGILLNYTERVFIEKSLQYLNQVIHAATQKAGFTYLDIEQSMKGKALCSNIISEAMNGIRIGNDIAIISNLPMLKIIGAGTFHPTPLGHALEADAILASHPGLSQDVTCATNSIVCGMPTISIEPPSFWGVINGQKTQQSYVVDFVRSISQSSPQQFIMSIPEETFKPNSTIRVEVHSDSIAVGSFVIDVNGGINTALEIPAGLESGFHTLHIFGTNTADEPIDMYQFVTVDKDGTVIWVSNGDKDYKDFSTNSSSVLGVSDATSNAPRSEFTLLEPIHVIRQTMKNKDLLILVVYGGIGVTLLAVLIILLKRKWAKPAS